MGLTYAQCQALGLAHLWPDNLPRSGKVVSPGLMVDAGKGIVLPPHGSTRPDDGMNKTERAFAEMLGMADVATWWREPIKLRLAGRTWYTPDFAVVPWRRRASVSLGEMVTLKATDRLCIVEVKGFMRDDAAVKLKVAAEMFSCFRWLLVTRSGRHGWEVREVTRTGIGTSPIHVPWIQG